MFRAVQILSWSWLATGLLIACGPPNRDGVNVDAALHPPSDSGSNGSNSNASLSRVYAHTSTTLYRIDTQTLMPQTVGTMVGLGTEALTDIAIDKNDQMVGVTQTKLFSIDSTNGNVTLIKDLAGTVTGLTSLSYVPTNVNDPNSADILVTANNQGDVFQIDPSTGGATKIGSYGTVALGKVVSSGDLVGVRGLGIYATVKVGSSATDYLAKIDPATWTATPLNTATGFKSIFGLGYWAGKFYGFVDAGTNKGNVISIDQNTGVGTLLGAGTERWYGAGVSTDAPIIE